MSRAAAAQANESQTGLAPLRPVWNFNDLTGTLKGQLSGFEIMSQQPAPGMVNTDNLYGVVATAGNKTMLGLLGGITEEVVFNGQTWQTVSFEIVFDDKSYFFYGGVLDAKGCEITGGKIRRCPDAADVDDADVDDGTWSAQAQPINPDDDEGKGDKPDKGRRRERTRLRRH